MAKPSILVEVGASIAGYDRKAIEQIVEVLQREVVDANRTIGLLKIDNESLRESIATIQRKLDNKPPTGYAEVGAAFEQTLRLAEEEAQRLVHESGVEAIRIRDEARAKAEAVVNDAKNQGARQIAESRKLAGEINTEAQRILKEAQNKYAEVTTAANEQLVQSQQLATKMVSEAERIVAEQMADLQAKTEAINVRNLELEKQNVELELAINQRTTEAEVSTAAIYEEAKASAKRLVDDGRQAYDSATDQAVEIMSQAEAILAKAKADADEISEEARSLALNLVKESRQRAEQLASRAATITRSTILDAEARLARSQNEEKSITSFITEVRGLLSLENSLVLDEVAAFEQSQIAQTPLSGEIMP